MADDPTTVPVEYSAVRNALCVLDGLAKALQQVARHGDAEHADSAREDLNTLRKIRRHLLPDAPTGDMWNRQTYGGPDEWFDGIAFAFSKGVPPPPQPRPRPPVIPGQPNRH